MKRSFQDDCDVALAETMKAGAFVRQNITPPDHTYDSAQPIMSDQDIHAHRKELRALRAEKLAKVAERDKQRELGANNLSITRPVPMGLTEAKAKAPRVRGRPKSGKGRSLAQRARKDISEFSEGSRRKLAALAVFHKGMAPSQGKRHRFRPFWDGETRQVLPSRTR